jgi:hypothetical protein
MTTVEPLKSKRRRDCTRCFGAATHRVLYDGKKTNAFACCWCARRIENGALILVGTALLEPLRRKAKRTGES